MNGQAGEPLALACLFPLECWLHEIENVVCLAHCCGLGPENSAWDRGAAGSMFDGWIKEYLSSIRTKNWGRQQCDNDVGSPKLKLCIKNGWQFQEPRAVAEDSAPIKDNGMWASRLSSCYYQQHYRLSTAFTIMHNDSPCTKIQQPPNSLPLLN